MITEDYVSFEIAKLLKEKGFECEKNSVTAIYNEIGKFLSLSTSTDKYYYDYSDFDEYDYVAPTLQMAMKWLREVHSIFIDIVSRFSMNADLDVCFSYSCKKLIGRYKSGYEYEDGEWLNYEEACEAAIKHCLENLI